VIKIHYQQRCFSESVSTESIGTEDMATTIGRVMNMNAKRRMSWISRRQGLDHAVDAASGSARPQPQSPPVNHSRTHPPTLQLPAKLTPTSDRRRQGSISNSRPQYGQPASTSEPQPLKRTVASPVLPEFAFPGLPSIISGKSLKNPPGGTLPVRSAWRQGPPPVWGPPPSWSPPDPEFQFDPESEPDFEPGPGPELEPYPESEPTTADGREGKGKQKQTPFHGVDCSCCSCFPSLSPY